jgi:triacylglycerol esterase/lipase EstA (alpha/beta hydrolase family)
MWIIIQFVAALTLDLVLLIHAPIVWAAYRIGVFLTGFRAVEGRRPAKRHIILLHGSGFNQSQWVLAKLYLRYFLADDSVHIHSFDYANQFTNEPGDGIDTYVHGVIRKRIKQIAALDPSAPIALIGHSMGGLAAADYAGNVATSEGVLVDRCIPLCAPWRGAPVLRNRSYTKTKRRYAQMTPGSGYLQRLAGSQWTRAFLNCSASEARLICLFLSSSGVSTVRGQFLVLIGGVTTVC